MIAVPVLSKRVDAAAYTLVHCSTFTISSGGDGGTNYKLRKANKVMLWLHEASPSQDSKLVEIDRLSNILV